MKQTINKSILVVSLIFGMVMMVTAQKAPKYKDILPGILASEPAVAVAALKSELSRDPFNPSIFLQLGLIYDKRFNASDPIKDYRKAIANIVLTRETFALTRQYLNEKEVKKNKEEYINFAVYDAKGKFTVSIDSIYNQMQQVTAKMDLFEQHVPGIYKDFTRSYSHYDKANKQFTDIVGRYSTIKDLYLLFDQDLNLEFDEIKRNYDLSIEYFKSYKEKTAAYDVGYHQRFKIDSINVYKMDGLAVEINFLKNEVINIWDYTKWVSDVREYIDTEITKLRVMMIKNEKLTSIKLNRAKVDFDNGEFETMIVDKKFLFTLRKYDLKAVVEPLFLYKEHKHKMAHQELIAEVSNEDPNIPIERKVFAYGQLLNSIRDADSVLYQVDSRNIDFSYRKYKTFVDEYYNGTNGVRSFSENEKSTNAKSFDNYVNQIRRLSQSKFEKDTIEGNVKYKSKEIPDFIQPLPPIAEIASTPITTQRIENLDGSTYLGGVLLNQKEGKVATYICRKEPSGKVSWYKEFLLQMDSAGADSHTIPALLFGGQSGCTFVLRGQHIDTDATINTLFRFNEAGEQLLAKNLDVEAVPRTIDFIEEANSFLIGFNGDEMLSEGMSPSTMTLANYNLRGTLQWQYSNQFVGILTDVVITSDGFLLSGSYAMIKDNAGKISRVENGFAAYVIKVNNVGTWVNQRIFPANTSYITNIVVKAGDHCINIFGSKDTDQTGFETDPSQLVHLIVTKDLVVLSNSLK